MAEKNTNTDLYENASVGSMLDATQDDVITTNNLTQNENVNESVGEIATNVIEMVEAESSKSNNVNILSQLALIMEMMNNKFDQQNKNMRASSERISEMNDNLNTSLNEFKTEIK